MKKPIDYDTFALYIKGLSNAECYLAILLLGGRMTVDDLKRLWHKADNVYTTKPWFLAIVVVVL